MKLKLTCTDSWHNAELMDIETGMVIPCSKIALYHDYDDKDCNSNLSVDIRVPLHMIQLFPSELKVELEEIAEESQV